MSIQSSFNNMLGLGAGLMAIAGKDIFNRTRTNWGEVNPKRLSPADEELFQANWSETPEGQEQLAADVELGKEVEAEERKSQWETEDAPYSMPEDPGEMFAQYRKEKEARIATLQKSNHASHREALKQKKDYHKPYIRNRHGVKTIYDKKPGGM